jgi:DNA-binding response OmpR family regulator
MSKTILLVDDSPNEMKLMQAALADSGYTIVTATDGEQAIEQAMQHRPDLILLDVVLPKKNGYQVCRHLKNTNETSGAKVILITSKNQPSDRFWGMKQGADEYVVKPYIVKDLLAAIERTL